MHFYSYNIDNLCNLDYEKIFHIDFKYNVNGIEF